MSPIHRPGKRFGENNLQKILGRVLKLLELAAWRGQGLGLLPEGGVGNGAVKSHFSLQANILDLGETIKHFYISSPA